MKRNEFYFQYGKEILDRLVGGLGLIGLSWLYLLIAVAIELDDPGPVLFRQRRVGMRKDGRLTYFEILKFRTMYQNAPHEVPTHLLENPEQWITPVGRVLRRLSLDELPQLWNIAVRHDLSLVGPRPALWNQEDLIQERDRYGANGVMPGLTGLAQIRGRDELDIAEKARLDGVYVRNLSFHMDLRCFIGSLAAVLSCHGVAEGCSGQGEAQ